MRDNFWRPSVRATAIQTDDDCIGIGLRLGATEPGQSGRRARSAWPGLARLAFGSGERPSGLSYTSAAAAGRPRRASPRSYTSARASSPIAPAVRRDGRAHC